MAIDLRQMRYFIAVAEHLSFTRAAEEVFVAQQALSQQVKSLENNLGVELLRRDSRRVELTAAGKTYLTECKRILASVERAADHARAVAGGSAGELKIAYSVTAAHDTMPLIAESLTRSFPHVELEHREVFAGDISRLLRLGKFDIGIAPRTTYEDDFDQRIIRREKLHVALSTTHPLAATRHPLDLGQFAAETFQLWPRDMAPGYYDAVIAACRNAGFTPTLNPTAAGSNAWANIAAGSGVNLAVESLMSHLARGVTLRDLAAPSYMDMSAIWRLENRHPAVTAFLGVCEDVAQSQQWMTAVASPTA